MRREYLYGLAGLLVTAVVVAGVVSWQISARKPAPSAAAPTETAASPTAKLNAAPPARAEKPPSFDAVHIGSDGKAVIAGRAAPGSEVTVLDRGQPIGKATADANGEWVLLPADPLSSGNAQLSLSARKPGDASEQHSDATIAVLVPDYQQPPVALLLPQSGDAPAQIMQLPATHAAPGIALDVIQYDPAGHVGLAGRADPGADVKIYLNDRLAGEARADKSGNWSTKLAETIPVGPYNLRLETQKSDGAAGGKLALSLQRAAPSIIAASSDFVTVEPGNSLWRIARRNFGNGLRYVEIYRANESEIANPNLIYPGQKLALPAAARDAASSPLATSGAR